MPKTTNAEWQKTKQQKQDERRERDLKIAHELSNSGQVNNDFLKMVEGILWKKVEQLEVEVDYLKEQLKSKESKHNPSSNPYHKPYRTSETNL